MHLPFATIAMNVQLRQQKTRDKAVLSWEREVLGWIRQHWLNCAAPRNLSQLLNRTRLTV